jgi:hypothetical protein
MLLSKKIRLLWQEKIEPGYTSIIPKISFDRGKDWISLQTLAGNARTNTEDYLSSKSLENGYNQLDITLAMCPKIVPEIKQISARPNSIGFSAGTWYFAVCALTYDYPGFEINSTSSYFNGPISKVVSVTLNETSSVDLYIRYPEYTKGLAVYWGQDDGGTVTLKLHHVTNFVQKLKTTLTDIGTTIELLNEYPFPSYGTVKIDNEYIDYESCTWDTDHWELTGLTRGQRGSTAATHTTSFGNEIEVYLANYTGGIYGEIPERIYPKPTTSANLEQYLNFDSSSVLNLVSGGSTPTTLGTLEYSSDFALMGKTLKLPGTGVVKTNEALTDTGSLHLLHALVDLVDDANPYIFSALSGLWLAIDKTNLKPILGYDTTTILSSDDPRTPSLSKLDLDQLMLTWEPITGDLMNFKLYINENLVADIDSSIDSTTFTPGEPYIGGLQTGVDTYTNTYIGYIDEFRIYNTVLTLSDCSTILEEVLNSDSIYCGLIPIVHSGYYPDLDVDILGTKIQLYEPLIDKEFATTTPATYGYDYGISIDNWIVEHFYADQSIPTAEHLTYPIDPDAIKIRFDMTSDSQGFKTPEIKNVSTIISEVSLS